MERRHGILIEMLRHEALPAITSCSICNHSPGLYRCRDCFGVHLWCDHCCIVNHARLPFHRLQMWNGKCFEVSSLLNHGLTLDLHHYPDPCPSERNAASADNCGFDESEGSDEFPNVDDPEPTGHPQSRLRSHLTIVTSTGIFTRTVRWCACVTSPGQYAQLLLRAKLFPASFKHPQTAFTFEVLDHFRIDSLECKTAAMNFMSKIGRITNEAFPSKIPVSRVITLKSVQI